MHSYAEAHPEKQEEVKRAGWNSQVKVGSTKPCLTNLALGT